MYMYMPTLGLWTSHPFSAAWSSVAGTVYSEKSDSRESLNRLPGERRETMISFLIRRRDGFTNKMIEAAEKHPDGEVRVMALAEGPYGMQFFLLVHILIMKMNRKRAFSS